MGVLEGFPYEKSYEIFGKGKISPRYIGSYQIISRIGNISNELDLRVNSASVHPTFHMYMLKKYMGDPSFIVFVGDVDIKNLLLYEEIPIKILDRHVQKLITKEISLMQVLWRKQMVEKAT